VSFVNSSLFFVIFKMALTAAQRAKNYRDRIKKKKTKYIDFKRKDCERKARKRTVMNSTEKEEYRNKHRMAQQRYVQKLKEKSNNVMQPR